MEPLSPALAGRFLTTGPAGKAPRSLLFCTNTPFEWSSLNTNLHMSSPHFSFFTLPFWLLHSVYWSLKLPSWLMFSPFKWASQVAQWQSLPANPGDAVHSLGREDPLQKEMVTHSSTLAWEISWTEEPGGLQSMESQGVRQDWAHTHPDVSPITSGAMPLFPPLL